jgi:hypothetical protein
MLSYMASYYVLQRSILGMIPSRMRFMKLRRFRRGHAHFDYHSATSDDHPARNHRCTAFAPKILRRVRCKDDVDSGRS